MTTRRERAKEPAAKLNKQLAEEPLILYGIGFVVLLGFLCVGYIFVKKI